jgi:hypothetical protein
MVLVRLEYKEADLVKIKEIKGLKVVDVLLESRSNHNELAKTLNEIIDNLNQINTKLDAHPNSDLKESIEFLDAEVKTKLLPDLKSAMNTNLDRVKASLTVKVDGNSTKIVDQEAHSRRRNVIISGKAERDGEDIEQVVENFLTRDLKLSEDAVKQYLFRDMHRLPKSPKAPAAAPKPIIVAFIRQKDRNAVMRKAFELKDSGISIKTDLPKVLNDHRSALLTERKRLKEQNPTGKYRVTERGYKPILQKSDGFILVRGVDRVKWVDVTI